jgi:hypothetical protein
LEEKRLEVNNLKKTIMMATKMRMTMRGTESSSLAMATPIYKILLSGFMSDEEEGEDEGGTSDAAVSSR